MDHRPFWLFFSSADHFFVEGAKLYFFLLSFADLISLDFVIDTESGDNRPIVGRLHMGLGHLTVGRQTPMNGRTSGENRATTA